MGMAGSRPEVIVTQTKMIGTLLDAVQRIQVGGEVDLVASIKIAQLSLKHRQNKSAKPRIVVFNCSPVSNTEKELVQLGKRLRKNKVALDVVNFGHAENVPLLQAMVDACNNSKNSYFMDIPEGVTNVTDSIITSPIVNPDSFGEDAPAAAAGGDAPAAAAGGQFDMYGGVDPSLDPELANAIRISLEEAKAAEGPGDDAAAAEAPPASDPAPAQPEQPAAQEEAQADDPMGEEEEEMDEETRALLEEAKRLSMMDAEPAQEEEDKPQETAGNDADVIDEEFLGELMEDFDVKLDDKEKEDALKKKEEEKKE